MFNRLIPWFGRKTIDPPVKKPVEKEWLDSTRILNDRIEYHFRNIKSGTVYLLRTKEDSVALPCVLSQGDDWGASIGPTFLLYYDEIHERTYRPTVLHYEQWARTPKEYELSDPFVEAILSQMPEQLLRPSMMVKTALYAGRQALVQFHDICTELNQRKNNNKPYPEHIEELARHPDVIDYMVKLHAIGQSQTAFAAFCQKDEETINAFFAPLNVLNEVLTTSIHQATINRLREPLDVKADHDELTSIFKWSSTKLH